VSRKKRGREQKQARHWKKELSCKGKKGGLRRKGHRGEECLPQMRKEGGKNAGESRTLFVVNTGGGRELAEFFCKGETLSEEGKEEKILPSLRRGKLTGESSWQESGETATKERNAVAFYLEKTTSIS